MFKLCSLILMAGASTAVAGDVILPSGPLDAGDAYGASASANGAIVAVGAPGDDDAGLDVGAVYLFGGDPQSIQLAKLTPPGSSPGVTAFGEQLALAGDLLVVQSTQPDGNQRLHVFRRHKVTWSQVVSLQVIDLTTFATDGQRLIVGRDDLQNDLGFLDVYAVGATGLTLEASPTFVANPSSFTSPVSPQHIALEGDRFVVVLAAVIFPTLAQRAESWAFDGIDWSQEGVVVDYTSIFPSEQDLRLEEPVLLGDTVSIVRRFQQCLTTQPCDDPFWQVLEWQFDGSAWVGGVVSIDHLTSSSPGGLALSGQGLASLVHAFPLGTGASLRRVVKVGGVWTLDLDEPISENRSLAGATADLLLTTTDNPALPPLVELHGLDPWYSGGFGLVGSNGLIPQLTGTGPATPGSMATISLQDALPLTFTHLVIGLSRLGLPLKGGVLVPSPDIIIFGLPVDAAGSFSFDLIWPTLLPPATPFWFQQWVVDPAGPQGLVTSDTLLASPAG